MRSMSFSILTVDKERISSMSRVSSAFCLDMLDLTNYRRSNIIQRCQVRIIYQFIIGSIARRGRAADGRAQAQLRKFPPP
jgi:hypothetical protein